jgi:hypothetical protein
MHPTNHERRFARDFSTWKDIQSVLSEKAGRHGAATIERFGYKEALTHETIMAPPHSHRPRHGERKPDGFSQGHPLSRRRTAPHECFQLCRYSPRGKMLYDERGPAADSKHAPVGCYAKNFAPSLQRFCRFAYGVSIRIARKPRNSGHGESAKIGVHFQMLSHHEAHEGHEGFGLFFL